MPSKDICERCGDEFDAKPEDDERDEILCKDCRDVVDLYINKNLSGDRRLL